MGCLTKGSSNLELFGPEHLSGRLTSVWAFKTKGFLSLGLLGLSRKTHPTKTSGDLREDLLDPRFDAVKASTCVD
ncbi:hypothetical protein CEXT_87951 [Caerostris extrusa]|uniref:Uncharacterized protein n=1 Tax=Caerostris extrusa TaxID=172846 RepID=A0AAV4MMR9_CAEEX|nr:hypothetical protein CEXT_87951 [Caerostris extrusa]